MSSPSTWIDVVSGLLRIDHVYSQSNKRYYRRMKRTSAVGSPLIAPWPIRLADLRREVVDTQRPMMQVLDVVEDRRWLASCNPRV